MIDWNEKILAMIKPPKDKDEVAVLQVAAPQVSALALMVIAEKLDELILVIKEKGIEPRR